MPNVARNAEYTKEYNRKLILRLLRTQPMSRAEIARQTGLTRASTSLIAADLLAEGMVRELTPMEGLRGRMPTPLALCGTSGYAVGIFLNRDGCTAGVVDMCGKIVRQERLRMADAPNKMAPLSEAVARLIGGVPREKLCGIGVSAPGPLDGEKGRILNPPRFDLWHRTDIAPLLHEATGLPVYLENDATCLARYHIGRPESLGSRNFLLMIVDSGIGSGVVSKGKVLKGGGYYTSELGHTSIDYRGRRCACGNIGCLEEYAAIPKLLKDTPYTSWKQAVDANDTEILQREADYLSAGIVTLTNLVSIDTVLLSGDLLYGTEKIAPLLEQRVNARSLHHEDMPIKVAASSRAPGIKILAAADIAFERALTV